MLRQHNGV